MVGIACGLAVYTPIRHITHASDVALDAAARNSAACYEDADGGRTLKKALEYRSGGVLAKVARMNDYCNVLPDVGVDRSGHLDWKKGKKILDVKDFAAEAAQGAAGTA
jgi:hypothetical protein